MISLNTYSREIVKRGIYEWLSQWLLRSPESDLLCLAENSLLNENRRQSHSSIWSRKSRALKHSNSSLIFLFIHLFLAKCSHYMILRLHQSCSLLRNTQAANVSLALCDWFVVYCRLNSSSDSLIFTHTRRRAAEKSFLWNAILQVFVYFPLWT